MKLNKIRIEFALAACLLLITTAAPAVTAQTTIFDKPSTDIEAPGKVYLEADFITHFGSFADGGYQTYGPRVVVGLPGNMEIGVNAFYTRASGAQPLDLQPNFKWQFYADESRGLAAAAGVLFSIPVTHRRSGVTTAMLYAVASKTLGSDGPTFTGGGYTLAGRLEDGVTRNGVMLGFSQPITSKLEFLADWASGNNDYGYGTVATGLTLSKNSFYAGYNFGNHGRGNNSLGLYYGRHF